MYLTFRGGGGDRDLQVLRHRPDAFVADLVQALSPGAPKDTRLDIAGYLAASDLRLDEVGLCDGVVVQLPPPSPTPSGSGVAELSVIAGPDSGRVVRLEPGRLTIGRGAEADVVLGDPSVSRIHATVSVSLSGDCSLTDEGSRNGVEIDGRRLRGSQPVDRTMVVRLGDTVCLISPTLPPDQPAAIDPVRFSTTSGVIPFNRPPRRLPPAIELREVAPPSPPVKGSSSPFSVAALVMLVFGGYMVVFKQQYLYAVFALTGLGTWLEGKWRARHGSRAGARDYADRLSAFKSDLNRLRVAETRQRREATPDIREVVRRATTPSIRLWERRLGDGDFLRLSPGLGSVLWRPPVRMDQGSPDEAVSEAVKATSLLTDVPVEVDLSDGGVVGIVGPRPAALGVARSLVCQAVVHQGPADLAVAVLVSPAVVRDWDWTKWLPHVRNRQAGGDERMLASNSQARERLLRLLLENARPKEQVAAGWFGGEENAMGPVLLLVLDDETLTEGRSSMARTLLRGAAGPVAGIVVASAEDRLPAACTCVIRLSSDAPLAAVARPGRGEIVEGVTINGLAGNLAKGIAQAIARFDDPEIHVDGGGLPEGVLLLGLLDMETPTPEAVGVRWDAGGTIPNPTTPIGVGNDDVFAIDLADTPHGLVAGTTGSGKSELLRSLVAGLAASCDPDHLTFVLVDYKGGSAFAACSQLPHTVGFVTDLDEQLGQRALRCLNAEIKYREDVFKSVSATDLRDYLSRGLGPEYPTLPRLLVVIDEFAAMAAEIPDFMDSLVGIAQQGRALGVHMILATQRPSGVVNEAIKANMALRIALRVQDQASSQDIIEAPDACFISRAHPGRAYVRRDVGEPVILIQTALVTGSSQVENRLAVEVAPFVFGNTPQGDRPVASSTLAKVAEDSRDNDLTRLVEAIRTEAQRRGFGPPRQPWPAPLGPSIPLAAVLPNQGSPPDRIVFAMGDDPDRQAQYPIGWSLSGNLILYGIPGSGTTTALASVALSAASCRSPDDLHLYIVDFGAGDLGPLVGLPHAAAVISASERERQIRLIRHLREVLGRRKEMAAGERAVEARFVVLIDNAGGLIAELDNGTGDGVLQDLTRVWAEGTDVGIHLALSADRIGAVPSSMASLCEQKWLFRMADPYDYANFGIKANQVPRALPGRAVLANSAQVAQVAWAGGDLSEAVRLVATKTAQPSRPPRPIGSLPSRVAVSEIATAARLEAHPWLVPIGIGDTSLGPVCLRLYEGEHATIAGGGRTGKSNALAVLAACARAGPDVRVTGVSLRRSPLQESPDLDSLVADRQALSMLYGQVESSGQPQLILVDDAEQVDDEGDVFARLLALGRPDVHLVVAGRADALRTSYGHWTQVVRRSKVGVLLRPDVDLDGDLLGVALPRRHQVKQQVGRGFLVDNGEWEVVQLALSNGSSPA